MKTENVLDALEDDFSRARWILKNERARVLAVLADDPELRDRMEKLAADLFGVFELLESQEAL